MAKEEILGALARGYCTERNARKVLDAALLEDMEQELSRVFGRRHTMNQEITEDNKVNEQGNPAGGRTTGIGISINWQDGPLAEDGQIKEPTGAFVEGVVNAAVGRLQFYQASQFKCFENAMALTHLLQALHWLNHRTEIRLVRGIEGTY